MAVKVVSFDVAGTLLHFARPVAAVYADFAARHGISCTSEEVAVRLPAVFAAASSMAPPADQDPAIYERRWWREILARCLDVAPEDERLASCFAEVFDYYATPAAWRLHPGLPTLLGELREAGLRLAICSNFDGRLFGILEQTGLREFFDVVVLPRHAGRQKPDAAIFGYMVETFGVLPEECLHVGDSVENDAVAARLAGLQGLQWSLKPEADLEMAAQQLRQSMPGTGRPVYRTPDVWRDVAMARPDGVDDLEAARRRAVARRHYTESGMMPDPDTLADHELFIRGKMTLDEYQEYLVCKHSDSEKGEK
ncbi:MAG TPA: HAD-IA family hydrolase [Mariprofundaceae bacterium]|nr:HAD-IA family hydrolase [Mariprofundaceae bacterium]